MKDQVVLSILNVRLRCMCYGISNGTDREEKTKQYYIFRVEGKRVGEDLCHTEKSTVKSLFNMI